MKQCIACTEPKPLTEFYLHAKSADGHFGKCKACCRAYAKGRPDIRFKTPKRAQHNKANTAKFRRENPEKYAAHIAVNNAVRDGRLIPQPCEVCGEKAHAHHDDYSKPLKVRWLCPLHHARHHAEPF